MSLSKEWSKVINKMGEEQSNRMKKTREILGEPDTIIGDLETNEAYGVWRDKKSVIIADVFRKDGKIIVNTGSIKIYNDSFISVLKRAQKLKQRDIEQKLENLANE